MSEIRMIPDSADKEVDWMLDSDAAEAAHEPLREVSSHFGRNVSATIFARVVNMARGVCLVPFLLRHIGLEAYGIWTTIFILVSYVGVTTLGLSNVYIKYVAEFHARREYEKANSLLSTGLCITVPLCGAIFAGFWFGWNWYAPWLRLPPQHAADGKEAVLIVLAVFLSSIAFNAFGDILTGVQQIASTQLFLTFSILVEFALIVWFVSTGRGIRGLAEAYLVRTILNDGLTIWWSWRQLKWMRISPRLIRRESLRYVIHFGGVVQFQTMLGIFLTSVERVAGLGLINASAAGLMDVAKKWPTSLSSVPTAFFAALLPAAAHVDAASDSPDRMSNLRELYLSSSRYANLCTSAFVAVIIFWSHPILHVWLGPELPMRHTLVALFVVFSFAMQFHMLTGPGTSMFRGMGRVYEEFSYSIPNLLLLGVTLPLAWWVEKGWTSLGIGVAVSVATMGSACVLMARVHHVLGLSLERFFWVVIVPGLAPYLSAAVLAWPVAWLAGSVGRWQGAGVLLAAGIVYAAGSVFILHRWALTEEEKENGRGLYRKALAMIQGREATA
jgi:O-antigen/teichoic acid export membrane protein